MISRPVTLIDVEEKSVLPAQLPFSLNDHSGGVFSLVFSQTAGRCKIYLKLNYRRQFRKKGDLFLHDLVINRAPQSDCPAPGWKQHPCSPWFSCNHWLLIRRCSFSTMIPGTAPRRHTSPTLGDASSQVMTKSVDRDQCAARKVHLWVLSQTHAKHTQMWFLKIVLRLNENGVNTLLDTLTDHCRL